MYPLSIEARQTADSFQPRRGAMTIEIRQSEVENPEGVKHFPLIKRLLNNPMSPLRGLGITFGN